MSDNDVPGQVPLTLSWHRNVHIVGIGGAGMSGIATLLLSGGHRVTGTDSAGSAAFERVVAQGATAFLGHDREKLPGDTDVVVVSTAIPETNPEVVAARSCGIPVYRRSDALGAIINGHRASGGRSLGIAGTHGKTTTTAMLTSVLLGAGQDPSYLIGGEVIGEIFSEDLGGPPLSARGGSGEWIIVEADESDGTFLELELDAAILTNIDADHLDYHKDFNSLRGAFEKFLEGVRGTRLVGADNIDSAAVAARVEGVISYGFADNADYRIANYFGDRSGSTFEIVNLDGTITAISLSVPGRHNALNATGAAAMAREIGISPSDVANGLGQYGGVGRRFQVRGMVDGVTLVEDYAHLPAEIRTAIMTAREGGWNRILVAFQPHRYSRTASLWPEFAGAFEGADEIVITDIYGSDEIPVAGVTGELIHGAVQGASPNQVVHYVERLDELSGVMRALGRPGDVVLFLGAGDICSAIDRWLAPPMD